MTIDFQQVREQVKQLGKIAKVRAEQLQNLQKSGWGAARKIFGRQPTAAGAHRADQPSFRC